MPNPTQMCVLVVVVLPILLTLAAGIIEFIIPFYSFEAKNAAGCVTKIGISLASLHAECSGACNSTRCGTFDYSSEYICNPLTGYTLDLPTRSNCSNTLQLLMASTITLGVGFGASLFSMLLWYYYLCYYCCCTAEFEISNVKYACPLPFIIISVMGLLMDATYLVVGTVGVKLGSNGDWVAAGLTGDCQFPLCFVGNGQYLGSSFVTSSTFSAGKIMLIVSLAFLIVFLGFGCNAERNKGSRPTERA